MSINLLEIPETRLTKNLHLFMIRTPQGWFIKMNVWQFKPRPKDGNPLVIHYRWRIW